VRSPLDAWIARLTGIPGPDPAGLRAWRQQRLLALIRWCMLRSPFYARHLRAFAGSDLDPDSIPALPCTTAEHLRHQALDMLCLSQSAVERIVSLGTSGTTGPPKRLFFSIQDLEATLDFFRVGMSTCTGPGDTALILIPGRRPDGAADLLARALQDIGVRAVTAPQPCSPKEAAVLIRREEITCLAMLASHLRSLLDDPSALAAMTGQVRTVLLSGEPVSETLRADARRAGLEVFDHYGLTETCFGGGVECRAHSGYHLRQADLYLEIVDPRTGRSLPPGTTGEVVVSTLSRRAMPLVRYRTGDLAGLVPGPCPCGSPLDRLGPIVGRIAQSGTGFVRIHPRKGTGISS
jgi:phenylacetate-CoA ligase